MKYLKNIGKIILWIGTGAILLLLMFLFALQSGMLNSFIASTVSTQGTKAINGQFNIEQIEGNLLSRFVLKEINISQADSTVLKLEKLKLDYKVTHLLQKKIKVNQIHLKDLQIHATQMPDSSWNLQQLIDPTTQKDTSSSPSAWEVEIEQFLLDSLTARLHPLDSQKLPKQVKLKIQLALMMHPNTLSLNMQDFYLRTQSPYLQLNNMTGTVRKERSHLAWDNFLLNFDKTNLYSQGKLNLDSLLNSEADLIVSPLNLNEFQAWMPETKIYGTPEIRLKMKPGDKQSNLYFTMHEAKQQIQLSGVFNHSKKQPEYSFSLFVDSLDGMHWTGRKELQSLINGKLHIEGAGTNFKENHIQAQGAFQKAIYGDYKLDTLQFNINKNKSHIAGKAEINAKAGHFITQFELKDLFSKLKYTFNGKFQEINLAELPGNKNYSSNLNFKLNATGSGTKPDSMKSNISMSFAPSSLLNEPISSMDVAITFDHGNYSVNTFDLNSAFASLNMKGAGHYRKNNNLQYFLKINNINELSREMLQKDIAVTGNIEGSLNGSLDSLTAQNTFDLANLRYDSLSARHLKGTISGLYGDSVRTGQINMAIDSVLTGKSSIKNVTIDGKYQNKEFASLLNLSVHDSLNLITRSKIMLATDPLIHLKNLKLDAWNQQWSGGSDSTTILLAKDSIRVNQIQIQSDSQKVKINGTFAFRSQENMTIQLKDISLSPLKRFANSPSVLGGKLNSTIHLKGTAERPVLNSRFHIDHPQFDSLLFRKIQTDLSYSDDSVKFTGELYTNHDTLLQASAHIPYHLSLTDTLSTPDKSTPVKASLFINQFDISSINPWLAKPGLLVNGNLSMDATVNNTLGDPKYKGKVEMKQGSLQWKKMGINYNDIALQSRFSNKALELKRLSLNSGKGSLTANGKVELGLVTPKKENKLYINIKGNSFQALNTELAEATIAPDIVLEGTIEKPVIKGNIQIIRSVINSDVLMDQFAVKTDNPNPPLLVKAMKDTAKKEINVSRDSIPIEQKPNFYKNLRGTFNLAIPGNTWVRGKDMNFELQGDLKAIKQKEQIDLFGTLNINRGYIEYFGKKFNFDRGKLTFTGGTDINPLVDFRILYDFRDPERELHTIALEVTGKSRTPEMTFYMDDKRIEEREALSYIIFGKSTNQLSEHERTSVEQSAKNLAGSLAMDQVSMLIKDALRNSVGLDVVEISSGENWKAGSVKIGKYITNNLYLGYQQTFAFNKKEKTIEPEKITLEYQILRSLFLQATNQSSNSGFDIIFKKSWK